jgi:hypothetical protein
MEQGIFKIFKNLKSDTVSHDLLNSHIFNSNTSNKDEFKKPEEALMNLDQLLMMEPTRLASTIF